MLWVGSGSSSGSVVTVEGGGTVDATRGEETSSISPDVDVTDPAEHAAATTKSASVTALIPIGEMIRAHPCQPSLVRCAPSPGILGGMADKVTAPMIRDRKGGPKISMVTAYDYPGAVIADRAGVDIILIGDSVANVVHGMDDTLGMTVDEMILHTRAVKRANPSALVVTDMPWLSFHISPEESVRNAGRLVREGGAEAVKLEGGIKRLPMVQAIMDAEIPVMGHVGLTPQSVHRMGGFKVQGKVVEVAREMIEDAKALSEAGCFSIVIEGVPDILGELITKEVDAPTIGIGAGPGTDGQVLVFHDLLGLGSGRYPKFVRSYATLADQAVDAIEQFVADVESGSFPGDDESYHVADEIAAELLRRPESD